MLNPFNKEKELPAKDAEFVTTLREVRKNARSALRSGNPARRAAGAKALSEVPQLIAAVYRKNAS